MLLCNPNTHAVHSKVAIKYSVARSKSYISLSTLLTIIPCYTRHVYTPKAFDAFLIKLRPRRFQPNSRNWYSSRWVGDMILQSGLTNHFCFDYICTKNEGDNKRNVDS